MDELLIAAKKRPVKCRYNLMFYPADIKRIDSVARRFDMSRSELLLFVFDYADSQLALTATGKGDAE